MDSVLTSAGVAGALTSPSPTRDPSEETFSFMDLPAELRVKVYEHLIVVGKVFFTPDWYKGRESVRFKDWTEFCAPSLQILRVSKQVQLEAEDVYLPKNLFVLPYHFNVHPPFYDRSRQSRWDFPDLDRPVFSVTALKTLKNLGVSFNPRPLPSLTTLTADWAKDGNPDFDAMTPLERRDYAHDDAFSWLQKFWDEILRGL